MASMPLPSLAHLVGVYHYCLIPGGINCFVLLRIKVLARVSSHAMNLFQFILVAFSALSLAIAQSHDPFGPTALEVRAGHRRRHRHDHDVRPDFRQPCICGPDSCPLFLNKKSVSSYLEIEESLSDISL